jgi:hypothetical protein
MRADVGRDQTVRFEGSIAVPPGAGSIIAAEWDLSGDGRFTTTSAVPRGAASARVKITHRFDQPGTFFVALRATAQRQGRAATPYARIENLDRVRVTVR